MKYGIGLGVAAVWCAMAPVTQAAVRYVWKDNPGAPVFPYTSGWAEAATNIQQAVDAAVAGDTVLVTNGVYDAGGRVAPGDTTLITRVIVTNAVTIVSANGPEVTLIVGQPHTTGGLGDKAVRCVYLQTNSVLSGFTVTNGFTRSGTSSYVYYYGGGIRSEGAGALITNCVIVGNTAAMQGGGVYRGTLLDCVVASNAVSGSSSQGGGAHSVTARSTRFERNRAASTSSDGGGAFASTLIGCAVVSNAAGRSGGGVYTTPLTSCLVENNVAGTSGGGAYTPVSVSNCVVRGNRAAVAGGGIYQGVAYDTLIQSNRVTGATGDGGGFYGNAVSHRLVRCTVEANETVRNGGGVYYAVLSNCVVRANVASGASGSGGGVYAGGPTYIVSCCHIFDNEAAYRGGGAYQGNFYSCVFSGNRAAEGGGYYGSSGGLYSCSVLGNSASSRYGGTYSGTVRNSIVYGNEAPTNSNWDSSTMTYSCADPKPGGTGNTNVNPMVSGYRAPHLLLESPLIGKGLVEAWMTGAADLDGQPRVSGGATDMGADQVYGDALLGALSVSILSATNLCAVGWPHDFRAECTGLPGGLVWDFGDGSAWVTNLNPVAHAYAAPGDYVVRATATNATGSADATFLLHVLLPAVFYVSPVGGQSPPFATWETAATNLQDALDAAAVLPGSQVLVTNGVYATGGRAAAGHTISNRACVGRETRMRSVNGPHVTSIVGAPHPGSGDGGLGNAAVRGVYLDAGASIAGFTVSGGFTRSGAMSSEDYYGGGILCATAGNTVSNCIIVGSSAAMKGGGIYQGILTDCVVSSNTLRTTGTSAYGGGVCAVTASGCNLESNRTVGASTDGGAAAKSLLADCVLRNNVSGRDGGGVFEGALSGCLIEGNESVRNGGGVYNATLSNCMVRANRALGSSATTGIGGGFYATSYSAYRCYFLDNEAAYRGGGAYQGIFYSCVFSGNRAAEGGGFYSSSTSYRLNSCAVMGNAATYQCGGTYSGTIRNCIVYGNEAPLYPNWSSGTITYTCTDPQPADTGNTNVNPRVSGFREPHLLPDSPLIGKGLVEAWMAAAEDLDGEPRVTGGLVDVGPDQCYSGALQGPLAVAISTSTNACAIGWAHGFHADASGLVGGLVWDFGDGSAAVTNLNPVTHVFTAPGDYLVRVTVTNATGSAVATLSMHVVAAVVFYVSPYGGHAYPFDTWERAATNLQDAIDAAALPDSLVIVTNGLYASGGRAFAGQALTNRACVTRPVRLRSVNGAEHTLIVGAPHPGSAEGGLGTAAVRGVYLADGASLAGFTVSNGFTRSTSSVNEDLYGGGILCVAPGCVVSNCVVIGNRADSRGGGVYQGTLFDCTIASNTVDFFGGGAYNATLSNCVVRANRAIGTSSTTGQGGGLYVSDTSFPAFNTRFLDNEARYQGGGAFQGNYYSCVFNGNRAAEGAGFYGFATASGWLFSCSVMGNTATVKYGGVYSGTIKNSIVYGNEAPAYPNWYASAVTYSCTLPLSAGAGNYDADPVVSGYREPHLLLSSPLIGQGISEAWMAGARDLDGEPRVSDGLTDIGADQYYGDGLEGPLTVSIVSVTNVCALDYPHAFRVEAAGKVGGIVWDFGDGAGASGAASVSHAFSTAGVYTVGVTVTNATHSASAAFVLTVVDYVRYVSLSGGHVAPFDTWEKAATNIQHAVDVVGLAGGRVLVAAGLYASGGRVFGSEAVTNRLIVTNTVRVCAVDGPGATFIVGAASAAPVQDGLGSGAVRGVRLLGGAQLCGFTVTNGHTRWNSSATLSTPDYLGGGVFCADGSCLVSNCVVVGNAASGYGGGVHQGVVLSCTLERNAASATGSGGVGGGAYGTLLISNSTVRANTSYGAGGGVYLSGGSVAATRIDGNAVLGSANGGGCCAYAGEAIRGCVIVNNVCPSGGGGVYGATLYDCLLTNNTAQSGGGYAYDTSSRSLYRCRLSGNRAAASGGGASYGTLVNCVVSGNSAGSGGGGTYFSALENSTVLGNEAARGGGVYAATAYNSVIYYNRANLNAEYAYSTIVRGCTTPFEEGSTEAIVTAAPQVTGFRDPHLLSGSPCIDAGSYRWWMSGANNLDIDGEERLTGLTADIGADERQTNLLSGPLEVTLAVDQPVIGAGYAPVLWADAVGKVGVLHWDFGDGAAAANQNPARHAFPGVGVYTVRVTVSNLTHSAFAELSVTVVPSDYYVAAAGGHVAPFTSWATAATNIQDAVDAAIWGGTVWLADGEHACGGRPAPGLAQTNRVVIDKPVTVRGANGPARAAIKGAWHAPGETALGGAAVRGVYLGHPDARLADVTVTGGATGWSEDDGGGVYSAFAEAGGSNCVVAACESGDEGGGVWGGTWQACEFRENVAGWGGGGAAAATLAGCLLSSNVAAYCGGGGYDCVLSDCGVAANACLEADGGGLYGSDAVRCVLSGNSAYDDGGGAYEGYIECCLVVGNASAYAGGVSDATVDACTVVGNTAETYAGGVGWCTVVNSIVWGNGAPANTNAAYSSFWHCLTTPVPAGGDDWGGNLDADPQFVNAAAGNYRPSETSPCVNAGTYSGYVASEGAADLDGLARVIGASADIGAYECQVDDGRAALGTPYDWLDLYGLGPDYDAAELDDPDDDGTPTWQEYVALTSPTNGASVFAVLDVAYATNTVAVSFNTSTGRVYTVQRSAALAPASWDDATAPAAGTGGRLTLTVPDDDGAAFYRARVALPQ